MNNAMRKAKQRKMYTYINNDMRVSVTYYTVCQKVEVIYICFPVNWDICTCIRTFDELTCEYDIYTCIYI